jgi:hypothetical protein
MDTCEKLRCTCGNDLLIHYPSVRKPNITVAAECIICGHMWFTEQGEALTHLVDESRHLLASA